MHKVFLIVGESGCGKDTLVNNVCARLGLKQLRSYATRPQRDGEKDTHIFIARSEVKKYTKDMIAYTAIGKHEYFATKQQLYENDVYIIDYDGIRTLKYNTADVADIEFVTIVIKVQDGIREQRALDTRKDDALVFYKRCFSERQQFTDMYSAVDYDYLITNNDLNKATDVLASIVNIERNW